MGSGVTCLEGPKALRAAVSVTGTVASLVITGIAISRLVECDQGLANWALLCAGVGIAALAELAVRVIDPPQKKVRRQDPPSTVDDAFPQWKDEFHTDLAALKADAKALLAPRPVRGPGHTSDQISARADKAFARLRNRPQNGPGPLPADARA